jgi:hypothetical protein
MSESLPLSRSHKRGKALVNDLQLFFPERDKY